MVIQSRHMADGSAPPGGRRSEQPGENMQFQEKRGLSLWGKTALFILFLFGLTLSVVFPYGIGFAVFLWIIALAGAVFGVSIICYGLLKDMLGRTATFGYTPNVSYMTGNKTRKKKEEKSVSKEKEK